MANYGELLNTFYPINDTFYSHIDSYFNHPTLTKIKDVNDYTVYMVKTDCLLSNDFRYIIAMVDKDDNKEGTTKLLAELAWVSFQTRTMNDNHKINTHTYQPVFSGELLKQIDRTETTKHMSVYMCESYPVKIVMLHRKANILSEYQSSGNIISALETYQTIISFTN